jgi:hypothetical protein
MLNIPVIPHIFFIYKSLFLNALSMVSASFTAVAIALTTKLAPVAASPQAKNLRMSGFETFINAYCVEPGVF